MPYLTVLEGDGNNLNEYDRQAIDDPRITYLIGLLYYKAHPEELKQSLARAGHSSYNPARPQRETLGFLPALAAFLAPIATVGLTAFFQAKGSQVIADNQAGVYAEQLKVLQAEKERESESQAALFKLAALGVGGLMATVLIFKILK